MPVHQTEFGGVQMRSQLEAQWAAALDEMGFEWRYEPRRIPLPSGNYLPDFLVRAWCDAFYMEVKGPDPTTREMSLCRELSVDVGGLCVLAHGSPDWGAEIHTWNHGSYEVVGNLSEAVALIDPLTAEEQAFCDRLREDCDRREANGVDWFATRTTG